MARAGGRAPVEAWSSWLGVAALVCLFLAFAAWVAWAGKSPGRVSGASPSASPFLTLRLGATARFRPNRIDQGSVIACQGGGVTVSAAVPPPGHFLSRHIDAVYGQGTTLGLVQRKDGSVEARCHY